MSDPSPRPPLTAAEALRRIAAEAIRRDASMVQKKHPTQDDSGRGGADTKQP